MDLLALYPPVSSGILPCRTSPRVRGDSHQRFRLGTPQRGTLPSQFPVSRLRLLQRRLHYRDHSWDGRTWPHCTLNQDVRRVGTRCRRPDGRPGGKGA